MFDRFDILEAYWLFGSLYHSGMGSIEYRYMGRANGCGFRPSRNLSYRSLTDNGKEIYKDLVRREMKARRAWERARINGGRDSFAAKA
jgi:hypothetical protein